MNFIPTVFSVKEVELMKRFLSSNLIHVLHVSVSSGRNHRHEGHSVNDDLITLQSQGDTHLDNVRGLQQQMHDKSFQEVLIKNRFFLNCQVAGKI